MKKILYLSLIALLLSACSTTKNQTEEKNISLNSQVTCSKYFTITGVNQSVLTLKAKVVADKIKNVLSNNAGIVNYLNCSPGMQVNPKTLIAKIVPDWSDPNIKNLLNQKKSLQQQITNMENIISSTKNNFSQQLQSLQIQKANLENQIEILEKNLEKLEQQKNYGIGDLSTQLKTLETQLKDLENSKNKLIQSKNAEIAKIDKNLSNLLVQTKNLANTILTKVDEIFGITEKNKHKNDAFEMYLSAKNTALKQQIKNQFHGVDAYSLDVNNLSDYLAKLISFVSLVKNAINLSVSAPVLPQTTIDAWYNLFTDYENSLVSLKNSIDQLIESKKTIANNYDNQILNIQTQINSVKNNIENIKSNKLDSYISSIDIQINQTKSQLETTKTNLENIKNQISSLEDQETIQIKQLENQLSQLKSSLKNVETSLSTQFIYAGVEGKVKSKGVSVGNKVGPNTLLCQIIPNQASLKLQVMGNVGELDSRMAENIGYGVVEFKDDSGKLCKLKIISKLPYKDPISQNNIYETEVIQNCSVNEGEVLSVKVKGITGDLLEDYQKNKIVKIPLDFVNNKITGYGVWILSGNETIYKKVKLGEIDGNFVEVLSGLKFGERICR